MTTIQAILSSTAIIVFLLLTEIIVTVISAKRIKQHINLTTFDNGLLERCIKSSIENSDFWKEYKTFWREHWENKIIAALRIGGEDKELSSLDANGKPASMLYKNAILFKTPVEGTDGHIKKTVYGVAYDPEWDIEHPNKAFKDIAEKNPQVFQTIKKSELGLLEYIREQISQRSGMALLDGRHLGLEAITSLSWLGGDEAEQIGWFNDESIMTIWNAIREEFAKTTENK